MSNKKPQRKRKKEKRIEFNWWSSGSSRDSSSSSSNGKTNGTGRWLGSVFSVAPVFDRSMSCRTFTRNSFSTPRALPSNKKRKDNKNAYTTVDKSVIFFSLTQSSESTTRHRIRVAIGPSCKLIPCDFVVDYDKFVLLKLSNKKGRSVRSNYAFGFMEFLRL